MKSLLVSLALAAGLVWAQAPGDSSEWRRAATTHRLGAYPKIHADGRIWFQFKAPDARKVEVRIGAANKTHGMERDKDGVWNLIIPPPGPGWQAYWMIVDGLIVSDPSSDMFYQNGYKSVVEAQAPGEDYYQAKPVPHGDVREHWFYSKVTQSFRRMYVYTPPDYDTNLKTRYPVLYLQHGAGEAEPEWTHAGRANFILDNLIAEKRALPMIVVMNNGFAYKPGEVAPAGSQPTPPGSTFEQVLLTEVIPDIDARFRTLTDREHRAMAGLSMGSRQTLQIALTHLDIFSHIGAFSRPGQPWEPKQYGTAFDDVAAFNKRVRVFWFGAGTTETAIYERTKEIVAQLQKAGVKHVYYESSGTAHEWQTWRRCLYQFAPLLFKQ